VKNDYIFEFPDPDLPIHYTTLLGYDDDFYIYICFFYFLAFEFLNVKYTSFYKPVLPFHLRLYVVAYVPPSWIVKNSKF